MEQEFRPNAHFEPWGPLISPEYEKEPITRSDIVVATVVWALTLTNVFIAIWVGWGQTKTSRKPWKSVYVWMIWLELFVSFVMGLECYLHLLKVIEPSFAFYFTIREQHAVKSDQ